MGSMSRRSVIRGIRGPGGSGRLGASIYRQRPGKDRGLSG